MTGIRRFPISILLALSTAVACTALCSSCAKHQASADQCRAAIVHMTEVQVDSIGQDDPNAAPDDEGRQWLKSQIPSQVKPAFVDQCVERMARSDVECTMTATTTDELVQRCHWKVMSGARGAALGF